MSSGEKSDESHRQPNKRMKEVTVSKPIIVGTISAAIGKKVQKDQSFMQVLIYKLGGAAMFAGWTKKIFLTS